MVFKVLFSRFYWSEEKQYYITKTEITSKLKLKLKSDYKYVKFSVVLRTVSVQIYS